MKEDFAAVSITTRAGAARSLNAYFETMTLTRYSVCSSLWIAFSWLRYEWRATDWEECHILPLLSQQDRKLANISALCGGGIQTRKTYCVQVPDNSLPHHRKEGKAFKPVELSSHRLQEVVIWKKLCH